MRFRPIFLCFTLVTLLSACGRLESPAVPDLVPAAATGGTVVGWGWNQYGQTNTPALPAGMSYTEVASGYAHSLALRSDGQVVGWGFNIYGQTNAPALPAGMSYTEVAGGDYHSLALRSDGQVVGWGYNTYGQTNAPALPAGMSYTEVAGGYAHSLALRSDGQVVAWGRNDYGQTNVPALPAGSSYLSVAAGRLHSLAIILKQSQTLSFTSNAPTGAKVGGFYTPTATATSGLSVTFGTSTPSTCTFSGGTVSFIAAGDCTVTANQTGDGAYNAAPQATQSFTIVQADTTAPTIILSSPTDGATYLLNQSVAASYSCTDGESGVASCAGTVANGSAIDTATVGTKSFTVITRDTVGNTTETTVSYKVAYAFSGFSSPVDNLPTLNVGKAGQSIPLKWRVTDANGTPITTLTNVQLSVASLSCSTGTTSDAIEVYASGSSGLQNLGSGYYQLNWKTMKSYAGSCKTLVLDLGDSSLHTSLFRFN